jgi:hypothetical protein
VSEDRSQMMFDILLGIQKDVGQIEREQTSQGIRLASLEEHFRGLLTSIYGMQADIADLKVRVDRIERRLGPMDTEH